MLLEHPRNISPEHCNDIANTPLSSCLLTGYSASCLEAAGHEVDVVEGYLDNLNHQAMAARLRTGRPDLVAVHLVYQWKIDHALFSLLAGLKKEGLWTHLTFYGYYPTFAYEELLLTHTWLDSVVVGEPEVTLTDLAQSLADPDGGGEILGLARRKNARDVLHSRRPPRKDLDSLPFPLRTEATFRLPEVNVQGSRGCYGRCTFCYVNPFYGSGTGWRARSPENIAAEIDRIVTERGARRFYFVDPNFFGPGDFGQARALRLATLLKPKNIRFGLEGRVNDIREETIEVLVEAGLRSILVGLESGSDHALKRMRKMTTVEQNERAIAILRRHGLKPNIGFIMFEPSSSLADVRTNLTFLERNNLLGNLAITSNVLYHHQIILKGTPCYRELLRQGRLDLADPAAYEAGTTFDDPQVALLAAVMRRITNHIFQRMSGVFSGRNPVSSGALEDTLNGMLLHRFTSLLQALENHSFDPAAADEYVEATTREMDAASDDCARMTARATRPNHPQSLRRTPAK